MSEPAASEATANEKPIDPEDRLRVLDHLRSEQRLIPAIVAGCVAGLIGAAVWAAVAVFTKHEIAWIAIGVGFLVGLAVRIAGRGFEVRYAAIGGLLALAALLAGKIFTICGYVAQEDGESFWDVLINFPFDKLPAIIRGSFHPMDLLFYALAVWMGWKGARRSIEDDEIREQHRKLKTGV